MLSSTSATNLSTGLQKRVVKLMGNRFEITVVSGEVATAAQHIEAAIAEISRIEKILTTFDENSQTNLINRFAGIHPVQVDQEVFHLIKRSLLISALTQGAFDISYGGVDKKLWNFDQLMTALPDQQKAKEMVRLVNFRKILLDEKNLSVFLMEKGMRIGFGGIGKGYAAEQAKQLLLSRGVGSGIVNAAGDLTAWGNQPNGAPWTIGIANPNAAHHFFSSFNISNLAVATSGNYEKFVLIDGKRYSHTIDPKTGLPVSGMKSVTIICNNAEFADAIATPVMIMGVEAGLHLVNQLKGVACIIIDDNDRLFTSKNVKPA